MSFMSAKTPAPVEVPTAPEKSDAEVQAEALAERKRRRAALGSASTVLTGGSGVTNPSALAAKQLLGA
jgi:hypothetical protein